MSIAGIGSGGFDISMLQQMQQMAGGMSGVNGQPPQEMEKPDGTPPAEMWSAIETAAEEAGLSSDELESLRSDLTTAVSSIFENEDTETDTHEAVEEAVLSTLAEYGLDTEEIESEMTAARENMGNRPPGPPPGEMGGAQSTSGTDQLSALASLYQSESSTEGELSEYLMGLFPLVDEEA